MAKKPGTQAAESVAFAALRRSYADRRILVFVDPKVANRPGSPAHSATDVYAPPLILFGASITLLLSFGVLQWIVAMLAAVLVWAFALPPIVRWRAQRRARRIAFASAAGFKSIWALGGFAVVLADWPERSCAAPHGDWRTFAADYLVDPVDRETAAAKVRATP